MVEGDLRPSSDTPTHVLLYQHFKGVGGITHTHSRYATMFAQARQEIPCLGTTHADHFYGPVPVTRPLTQRESRRPTKEHGPGDRRDVRRARSRGHAGVLVAGHGPFAWGPTAAKSVENAVALEAVAEMALGTLSTRTSNARRGIVSAGQTLLPQTWPGCLLRPEVTPILS